MGGVELEPGKRLLLNRHGAPVHLAHRPFQVLLYLIEHRERVVTRRELLDRFWEGHDVYEVALSKCVGAIRKALDDRTEDPRYIETRWAEGYRYIGPVTEQPFRPEPTVVEVERARGVKVVVEEEDETSPEREKVLRTESTAGPLILTGRSRLPWAARLATVFAAVALLAGAVVLYRSRSRSGGGQSAAIRSVAVLPLKNLTGDPANEYLSDGMTESLISALSRVGGLKVISRGSVFRYKDQEVDPRQAGQQLGVAAVLEGSVRREGDAVRVAVRLASAEDGRVLWASDTHDHTLRDIFALQEEVARGVATELRGKLSLEGAGN